jgi:hypothetical protein
LRSSVFWRCILTLIFLPTLHVVWFKGAEGPSKRYSETVGHANQATSGFSIQIVKNHDQPLLVVAG